MIRKKYALLPALMTVGLMGSVLTFSAVAFADDKNGEGGGGCGSCNPTPGPKGEKGDTGPQGPAGPSGGGSERSRDNDNDIDGYTSKRLKDRPYVCVINNQIYYVTYPSQCGNYMAYTRGGYPVYQGGAPRPVASAPPRRSAKAARRAPQREPRRAVERYAYADPGYGQYNYGRVPNYGVAPGYGGYSCGRGYRYTYEYGCLPKYGFGGGPVVKGGYYGSNAAVAQAVRRNSRADYGNGTGGLYVGNGVVTGSVPVGRVIPRRPRYYGAPSYDPGVNVHYGAPISPYDGY